jgi:putative lipoic acid-binding regulatory protein
MSLSDSHTPFPCLFPLSVIGENANGFQLTVTAIIHKHIPDIPEESFRLRPSREGKYLSVRVVFWAENRAQVDNLYRELGAQPLVKMIL